MSPYAFITTVTHGSLIGAIAPAGKSESYFRGLEQDDPSFFLVGENLPSFTAFSTGKLYLGFNDWGLPYNNPAVWDNAGSVTANVPSDGTVQVRINENQVYVPKLWTNKRKSKQEIIEQYGISFNLLENGTKSKLLISFKSLSNNYTIQSHRGGMLLLIAEMMNPVKDSLKTDFLDYSMNPIQGASLSYFEEVIVEILKHFSGNVGTIAEIFAKMIGAGKYEDINTNSTLFESKKDYTAVYVEWPTKYKQGKWIESNSVRLTVPLDVSYENAEKLMISHGVSLFLYAKPSCVPAPVAIMVDKIHLLSAKVTIESPTGLKFFIDKESVSLVENLKNACLRAAKNHPYLSISDRDRVLESHHAVVERGKIAEGAIRQALDESKRKYKNPCGKAGSLEPAHCLFKGYLELALERIFRKN